MRKQPDAFVENKSGVAMMRKVTLLKETMPMAADKEVFALKQDVLTISEASSWEVRL